MVSILYCRRTIIIINGHTHLILIRLEHYPVITDRDPERYEYDPKGPIFITVGTGGEDLYNFTGQAPFVVTQFQRHGFVNIDIVENGTRLNGKF